MAAARVVHIYLYFGLLGWDPPSPRSEDEFRSTTEPHNQAFNVQMSVTVID